jgi:hypothetical protein
MTTFRIHITSPKTLTSDDIKEFFPDNIGFSIAKLRNSFTVTVSFKNVPEVLNMGDEEEKPLSEILQRSDIEGYVDRHFFGFTALSSPDNAIAE